MGDDCIWRFKVEEKAVKVNPMWHVILSSSSYIRGSAVALGYLKLHNLRVRMRNVPALFLLLASALGLNFVLPCRTLLVSGVPARNL